LSILRRMQSTAAPILVAQKTRTAKSCKTAVVRAPKGVVKRIGQTKVMAALDTAACRRANGRIWVRAKFVDGGSGGTSTWQWCCA